MTQNPFQPILVRPGTSTREGIAAQAAEMSWRASRGWPREHYRKWVSSGSLVSVRKANLRDYLKVSGDDWCGNDTAAAGPLMVVSTAPSWVLNGKTEGWRAWGTVPPAHSASRIVINSDLNLDVGKLCSLAVVILHNSRGYNGQPLVVEEESLGRGHMGVLLLG